MLQLVNRTRFPASIALLPDVSGVDCLYTFVKGTFANGAQGAVPAEEQVPVSPGDEYVGEPGRSSLSAPSDVTLAKVGTDVLMQGHAYAPDGRPTRQLDVELALGQVRKRIRILGCRFWRSDGRSISDPEPFEVMPLVWERAFGGVDLVNEEPEHMLFEPRNPLGIGFRGADGSTQVDSLPLPNLEDPENLIASLSQRPAPACFAPVCPNWEPRAKYAGTYDHEWESTRAPYLPLDFDVRFFQAAPSGLIADGFLEGGEPFQITGATPSGVWQGTLPRLDVQVSVLLGSQRHSMQGRAQTVMFKPDAAQILMVWSAAFPCNRSALRIHEVEVRAETHD